MRDRESAWQKIMQKRLEEYAKEFGIALASLEARGLTVFEEETVLELAELEVTERKHFLAPEAAQAWFELKAAAANDGILLRVVSAFRSVERQAELIRRKCAGGESLEEILSVCAFPGYSEHHSGRAVDLAEPGGPLLNESFEKTEAFAWLSKRAHEFGFFLSYPGGNQQGYQHEPWHWCFHKTKADEAGRCQVNPDARLPALIIIDMQNCMRATVTGARNNTSAEEKILLLLSDWRKAGGTVVHVRHISQSAASPFRPGQPGVEFQESFAPRIGEYVLDKNVPDAFFRSGLETWLRARKINQLVIVGVSTNNSVEATVRTAGNHGFEVQLVADATFAFEKRDYNGVLRTAEDVHAMSLANLDGEYAAVVTTTVLRDGLRKSEENQSLSH